MEYKKLFVGPTFAKEDFITALSIIDVDAAYTDDGIIFDYDAFCEVHPAYLPHWVYLNREDMHSSLHTRPASMREFRAAQDANDDIKVVGTYATSAFGGYEFAQHNGEDMLYRVVFEDYVGEWELIEDYDIADDDCTIIYNIRGEKISQADIMRVGA